jgi:hypothetical protein
MEDIGDVARLIEQKINLLQEGRSQLKDKAHYKAETISNYERKIAIVLIKLKNGESLALDGNVIQKPPTTIAKEIARGICWEEKLALETAETEYKLTVEKLKSVEAELNGYQSIFRHLEKI